MGTKKEEDIFCLPDLGVSGTLAFNGGCEFERPTGWEPDTGLVGRPLRLFKELGGNFFDIPEEYREYEIKSNTNIDWNEWANGAYDKESKPEIATSFPEIDLPNYCQLLWESKNPDAKKAQKYLIDRSPIFTKYQSFLWSPQYKKYVIIPFIYKKKLIGWIARRIDKTEGLVHIKCGGFPTDYMFNQELIYHKNHKVVLVQEGTFDAIAFDSLCTFGSKLSKKQINLLKSVDKKIVLLPDYKSNEWRSYWEIAKENNWYLACPVYPGTNLINETDHIKDAGESLTKNGLLLTMRTIIESITKDYEYARMIYVRYSK